MPDFHEIFGAASNDQILLDRFALDMRRLFSLRRKRFTPGFRRRHIKLRIIQRNVVFDFAVLDDSLDLILIEYPLKRRRRLANFRLSRFGGRRLTPVLD